MGKRGAVVLLFVAVILAGCTRTVVVEKPAEEPDDEPAVEAVAEPKPEDAILGPLGLVVCIAADDGISCTHSTNLSGIPLSPVKNGPPYAYAMQGCEDPGTEWSCTGRFVGQGNDELPFPRSAWRHESRPPEGSWWCMTRADDFGVVQGVTCGNGSLFMNAQPLPGESIYEMGQCSMGEFDGTLDWTCRGTLFRSG